jgi:flagellar basal body rod protein FlgC
MQITNYSIPLSGIQAGVDRLSVAADNTARMNVPGAAKNRITHQTKAEGGVKSTIEKVPLNASNTEDTGEGTIHTNIDYTEEAVNNQRGSLAVKSNARVVKAQDELMQSLLDIKV